MSLLQRIQRKARRELLTRTAGVRGAAKAAIIGCGQISPDHLSAFQESGVATVVAASDVRAGAMASLLRHYPTVRAFRDYRTMINETQPDVVSICTWPQHHLEIVQLPRRRARLAVGAERIGADVAAAGIGDHVVGVQRAAELEARGLERRPARA